MSYLPVSLPPAAPFIVYSEQSTHQLALAPPSSVNTLPYRILLTRSAYGEQNSVQAGNVLHLLRHCDCVCHMPPVFHRRIERGFWDGLSPVFHPVDNGRRFAFTLVGRPCQKPTRLTAIQRQLLLLLRAEIGGIGWYTMYVTTHRASGMR